MKTRTPLLVFMALAVALMGAPAFAADPVAPAAAPLAAPATTAAAATVDNKIFDIGETAKDLKVVAEDGATVDLAKVGEKSKKLIMFTNTACSACRQEMEVIQTILPGKDVDLLVVSSDMGDFGRIASFRDSTKSGGTWFQDADFAIAPLFGFSFTPALVVLDKAGKVTYKSGGFNKRKEAEFTKNLKAQL